MRDHPGDQGVQRGNGEFAQGAVGDEAILAEHRQPQAFLDDEIVGTDHFGIAAQQLFVGNQQLGGTRVRREPHPALPTR